MHIATVRESLDAGSIFVPQLTQQPNSYKPPLLFWMGMLGESLFGRSLLADRSVVALLGAGTAVFLFLTAPPQASDPFGYLLGRAHYSMRRRLNRRMASCGMELTSEQCLVLVMLGCESPLNQQDLADRMFKDKTGISRLVSGMERKGLIRRISTIEDRRNNFVQLTEFGRSTLSTIQKQLSDVRVEACQGITEKDMETCRRVLQKLVDNLGACEEQGG